MLIITGHEWQRTLYHSIDGTSCMIALISPSYLKSAVCMEEYSLAQTKHLSQVSCFFGVKQRSSLWLKFIWAHLHWKKIEKPLVLGCHWNIQVSWWCCVCTNCLCSCDIANHLLVIWDQALTLQKRGGFFNSGFWLCLIYIVA